MELPVIPDKKHEMMYTQTRTTDSVCGYRPSDLGCESACRLLSSVLTIAVYC